ncbi:hypothetical protein [Bernardetia sp. MNP-M8]|uniref:hypothetical protein n=1 Tax=Bernardetia sp. MNP-M8 TaxID=3127470 RepID=UPI0030D2351B
MLYIHTLQKKLHDNFIEQKRNDPISGDKLQENDQIVICATCKSAFLIDSWLYIGQQHCGQSNTLKEIPFQKSLVISNNQVKLIQNKKQITYKKEKKGVSPRKIMFGLFSILISTVVSCFVIVYLNNIALGFLSIPILFCLMMWIGTGIAREYDR